MSKVHIGKKIKEVLAKTPISVVDFAKRINLTRNGAYKVFEKETIDTGQLQTISTVLKHDFFSYYKQNLSSSAIKEHKSSLDYATKEELDIIVHSIELLSEKIDKLIETLPCKGTAKT
jgi:hypothetical protein